MFILSSTIEPRKKGGEGGQSGNQINSQQLRSGIINILEYKIQIQDNIHKMNKLNYDYWEQEYILGGKFKVFGKSTGLGVRRSGF